MPDKDINIHVRAQETRRTKTELDSVAKSAQQVGTKTAEGHKVAADSIEQATQKMSGMERALGRLKSLLLGLFGGAAAIRAVTAAIRAQSEAIKEHSRIALEQQNQLLRLQFLGDFFTEKPQLRREVMELAEFGKRPFEEVANAWYNLRSKGGGLTQAQQKEIMKQALEYGRTDPGAALNTLVDMFALYAKLTGQKDANRIQNVIRQTITEAGGSTGQVAQYMPQFLPVGIAGGLTGPEAAGLWSYVTTQFAEPSIATTGLRAVFMGLQGKGTPESQRLLRRLGIRPDMTFFEKISQLAAQQKAGKFSLGQAELIAQREGAATLLALLQNPEAMMKTVRSIVSAGQTDIDLTQKAITELFGQDELARMEELSRLFDIQIKNIKARNIKAVRLELGKKLHEKLMREKGISEWAIKYEKFMDNILSGLGFTFGRWEKDIPNINSESGVLEPAEPNNTAIIINDNSINYHPTVGRFEPQRVTFEE